MSKQREASQLKHTPQAVWPSDCAAELQWMLVAVAAATLRVLCWR